MANKESSDCKCNCGCGDKKSFYKHASDTIYGLGFVGAVIFFIERADTFWVGVLGVLKAIVWPAILIYKLLESLNI